MEQKIILTNEQVKEIMLGNIVRLTTEQNDEVINAVGKKMKSARNWLKRYIGDLKISNENNGLETGVQKKDGKVGYTFNSKDGSLTIYAPEFFEKFSSVVGYESAKVMAFREFTPNFDYFLKTVNVKWEETKEEAKEEAMER